MAENNRIYDAIEWYKKNKVWFIDLSAKVEAIIREILKKEDIVYHSIESRVKTLESFKEKAHLDKYKEPIQDITDIVGIRIITLFEKDVYEISQLIKEVFEIDSTKSEDKTDLLDADKMGYKSMHYIAKLKNNKTNLNENNAYEELSFEIQIRSILQHAWAEIEHDRNYKFQGELPKHLKRRFYALSGMLEIADREFNMLAEEVEDYKKSHNE